MVTNFLGGVPFFQNISLNGLSALAARGQKRVFSPNASLMGQGELGDTMYIIVSGRVSVKRTHPDLTEPLLLAELGPGEVIGEMRLLDGEPRSATVVALEETETMEMTARDLAETMVQYPEVAQTLLHILSRRLRTTDDLMAHVLEERITHALRQDQREGTEKENGQLNGQLKGGA